jgi:hypothetical protein
MLVSCSSIDADFLKDTLGLDTGKVKNIFSIDHGINPQGEGLSLDIFALDDIKEEDLLFQLYPDSFPIKYPIKEDWKIRTWTTTPINEERLTDFLFSYNVSNNPLLLEKMQEIKRLINSVDSFVCYFYKEENEDYMYATSIYILSLEEKRLYRVELIT